MNKKQLIDACVKLVTVNGRPFSIFEDVGMREIIEPILNSLQISINSKNIKTHLNEKASEIKEKIKDEVRGKMVSIKIDSASRLGRSIIGVNIQFISNGKIELRTLAMYDTKDRQTGIYVHCTYIKNVILEILKVFQQIYSLTSDNGRNMIKAFELLKYDEEDLAEFENELENETEFDETDNILNDIGLELI